MALVSPTRHSRCLQNHARSALQNVVDGCVAAGVPVLVYTSSASVVFEGRDLSGVDESTPYAARPMDFYTGTKIEGGWCQLRVGCTKFGGGWMGCWVGPAFGFGSARPPAGGAPTPALATQSTAPAAASAPVWLGCVGLGSRV